MTTTTVPLDESWDHAWKPKSLVKWVGGKHWLRDEYAHALPAPGSVGAYWEPFLGGGAVALHYLGKTRCHLSDVNERLINMYQVVRDAPKELIEHLKVLKYDCDMYYTVRSWYNAQAKATPVEYAAWLIYMNKTGFNGLYRVRQKDGAYNVPFGKHKNPTICDIQTIEAWSALLLWSGWTSLRATPWQLALEGVRGGDFVFLDSPYVPASTSANFTGYAKAGFGERDQLELAAALHGLNQVGAKFLLTNSQAARPLYGDHWHVREVSVARSVNSRGDRRGGVKEIMVSNYAW